MAEARLLTRRPGFGASGAGIAALLLPIALALACAAPGPSVRPQPSPPRPAPQAPKARPAPSQPAAAPPFRLADLASDGDAARRASVRLVLDGLEAEANGDASGATRTYQRALQVDPANPYAYLALARSYQEAGDPARALSFLDKADALLSAQGARDPSVEALVVGLRGEALGDTGREREAAALRARARALAPAAWSDGRLDADELR